MISITLKDPKQCHLWTAASLESKQIYEAIENVEVYEEDDDYVKRLDRCKRCGQQYFYLFEEESEHARGRDPMYTVLFPVNDTAEIDALKRADRWVELLDVHPRLEIDFPSNAEHPTVRWIRK